MMLNAENLLYNINRTLTRLLEIEEAREKRHPQGRTFSFTIKLPYPSDKVAKIFFDRSFNNENLPAGTMAHYPSSKISQLVIINEGPSDIKYSVNVSADSEETSSILEGLPAGEERPLSVEDNTIFSLFMRAERTIDPNTTLPAVVANVRIETLS